MVTGECEEERERQLEKDSQREGGKKSNRRRRMWRGRDG